MIRREVRFTILKDMIRHLAVEDQARWRELIDTMAEEYKAEEKHISKNAINAVMLLARRAQVIDTLKAKSLSTAPVMLRVKGAKALQDAIMRTDAVYVKEILASADTFDEAEAAVALYYEPQFARYLKTIIKNFERLGL